MTNTMNTIASIFTGKGGTLKLTILGSLIAAVIYEIMDAHYGLNVTTKDGGISMAPVYREDGQQIPVDTVKEGELSGQNRANTVFTDDQIIDKVE